MRREKGITLISLIITIVIMLILIAVTVNVLIESGIIGSAKNAANKTQTAYENEAVLNQITIGGVEYNSIEEYRESQKPVAGITASTIANATTKSDYYGKYVTGITLNNGDTDTQWRIFYADTNNIYLIAADYINVKSYISSDLVNYGGTDYKAYFTKTIALPAYDGGAEETAIFGEGTVGGELLKTYLDYLNANSSLAKNNPNMQATAFMLDTTAWSGYTDSNQETKYIDYAIGGPTIEMLRDSYNGYQGTTSMYTPVGNSGYYVGNASTATTITMNIGTTNSLYVSDTTTTKANSYWVVSPSANYNDELCIVNCYGNVYRSTYYANTYNPSNCGFRPVICLDTNAKLTPAGTDAYTVSY